MSFSHASRVISLLTETKAFEMSHDDPYMHVLLSNADSRSFLMIKLADAVLRCLCDPCWRSRVHCSLHGFGDDHARPALPRYLQEYYRFYCPQQWLVQLLRDWNQPTKLPLVSRHLGIPHCGQ